MKKINLFKTITGVVLVTLLSACGSAKKIDKATGSTEIEVPFEESKYRSDKDHFRAMQSGKSPDLATAKKIALQNAKSEMAGNIQSLMKRVTDQYTNQRTISDKQEFENKFEEMIRTVVKQELVDLKIIGEKTFQEADGKYTYWLAIETTKDAILNGAYDRISKDKKLQLDFDKHQYEKIFDEEMEKFEEEQGY